MRIGLVKDVLKARYNDAQVRNRAMFLIGPPGVGKSQVIKQTADELGIDFEDLRLAQCDMTEIRGVPSVVKGRTVMNPPSFFPEEGTSGILCLDELTSAVPAIQASAYQLILDRAAGEYRLPEGWMIVAAGNPQSSRGVTYQMAAPLMNRMSMVEVETSIDDFIGYASNQNLDPRVLSFLQARDEYLFQYNESYYGKQFPSPRSWFAVAQELGLGYDAETRVEMIRANVGNEAGIAMEGWLRTWQLMPSIQKIFTDPTDVRIPDDSERDILICLSMAIATKLTKEVFNNAWRYIKHLPKEFQPLIVKLAIDRDPNIRQATSFNEYIMANKSAFKR